MPVCITDRSSCCIPESFIQEFESGVHPLLHFFQCVFSLLILRPSLHFAPQRTTVFQFGKSFLSHPIDIFRGDAVFSLLTPHIPEFSVKGRICAKKGFKIISAVPVLFKAFRIIKDKLRMSPGKIVDIAVSKDII